MLADTVLTSAHQLRRRYIVALALIALLTLAAQALMQVLLASQAHDSRVVNIAGRQRMLSQRITKLSFYIADTHSAKDGARLRGELGEVLALWQRSHDGLLKGDEEQSLPGQNSPQVLALFQEIAPHFSAIAAATARIVAMPQGDPALAESIATIRANERAFLKGMDAIVFRYDEEANARVADAHRLEMVLGGVTLFVLLLEAFFIFAPAARRIEHDMRELADKEEDMERLFSVSPSALLLIERNSLNIAHANEKASELIGDPVDTLLHANLKDYVDQDYDTNRVFLGKVERGEALNEYEVILLDAQHTIIETLVSVRTIRFAGHEVLVLGVTDITELKKAQLTLEHHATFDDMTGMMNRRTGLMLLGKEMARRCRDGGQMSVCYLDVDGLKTVNDRLGHAEGDWLIRTVATTLRDHIRTSDSAVRLGGDEILLILHDCPDDEAQRLITRVQTRLKEVEISENKDFPISISHGIVRFDPARHLSPDELISEADQRMYEVKEKRHVSRLREVEAA
jgi:diguanylate cyclase (GGDEF)-like protein